MGPYASNDKQYIYAAYASDVFNLTDDLILNAGLRVDRFDEKGSFDPTTGATTGAYGQTSLSPKFGLVYQPVTEAVALFANYSNGFQNNSGVDFYGEAFKPSNGNQFEAGVKLDLWQHRFSGPYRKDEVIEIGLNHRPGTFYKQDFFRFDRHSLKLLKGAGSFAGRYRDAGVADRISRMNYDIHAGNTLS